jgi:hypothetical protein
MENKSLNNSKAYHYFLLVFILILGALTLYLSCNSKSPVEPTSPSNTTAAVKGTQQAVRTTTTSSIPSTIKSGKSQGNTTTIITSRTLTTTSTSTTTTTTSIADTTTTTRKTTTSIELAAKIRSCFATARIYSGSGAYGKVGAKAVREIIIYNGDTIYVNPGEDYITIPYMEIKNIGNAPAYQVEARCYRISPLPCNMNVLEIVVSKVKKLPNDGVCRKYPGGYSQTNADYTARYYPPAWIMILVYSSGPPDVCCTFEIVANWEGAANRRIFTFTVCKQGEPAN